MADTDNVEDESESHSRLPGRRMAVDWRMFNVVMLGVSFLLLFTAFQTCSMVQTLVLEGASHNGTDVGNGFTSLSIIYGSFAASNWIAAPIVAVVGEKWSMFASAIIYCLYIAVFFKPMAVTLYIGSAILGISAAVIWTAQGTFLNNNSTKDNIGRNAGIFWALFQGSLLFGNLFVSFNFRGQAAITSETRIVLCIVLLAVGAVGTALMISFRKTASVENADDINRSQLQRAKEAFLQSLRLFITVEMILLLALFAYTGLEQSFWSGVFITSVGHVELLGEQRKWLAGLCGVFIGIGEIVGGVVFGFLSHKFKFTSKSSVLVFGFIVHVIAFYVIFITFPADAPLKETENQSYFPPNQYVVLLCAFLLGLGDSSFNTQIYPLLGVLFPNSTAPAFALFKFLQSLGSAVAFVYSQYLMLEWQLLLLVVFATLGTVLAMIDEKLASGSRLAGYIDIQDSTS